MLFEKSILNLRHISQVHTYQQSATFYCSQALRQNLHLEFGTWSEKSLPEHLNYYEPNFSVEIFPSMIMWPKKKKSPLNFGSLKFKQVSLVRTLMWWQVRDVETANTVKRRICT